MSRLVSGGPVPLRFPMLSNNKICSDTYRVNDQVRTFLEDGEPRFVGMDVAGALGHAEPHKAIKRHCKYAKLFKPDETSGLKIGLRGVMAIQEPDVYRLIFTSKMPGAVIFQDWIYAEVIPTLRKTGKYEMRD